MEYSKKYRTQLWVGIRSRWEGLIDFREDLDWLQRELVIQSNKMHVYVSLDEIAFVILDSKSVHVNQGTVWYSESVGVGNKLPTEHHCHASIDPP